MSWAWLRDQLQSDIKYAYQTQSLNQDICGKQNRIEICLSTQKIYVPKDTIFERLHFVLFLVPKWREIKISKCYIFWVDRHISIFFSVLRSLRKVLWINVIRCPITQKPSIGAKFVTSLSRQNRENKPKKNSKNKPPVLQATRYRQ